MSAAAGVILLAVFMAVQELGIATDIVTTAFAILFGAVALALALAFGLGNRELAAEITRQWYERYRAERDEVQRLERRAVAQEEAQPGARRGRIERVAGAIFAGQNGLRNAVRDNFRNLLPS